MEEKSMNALLSVDEALQRILGSVQRLPARTIALRRAYGRILADDLIADEALPPFDNSSVDGFAVRAADATPQAGQPARLPVVMDIPAGVYPQAPLPPGTAARIMTGSVVPAGADAVVMMEQTDQRFVPADDTPPPDTVTIFQPPRPGDNIRRRGEDVQPGQRILAAGRPIYGAELGVLAALGIDPVAVVARPRVAVLSSGSELIEPDQPLTPGKIRNANAYALRGLIRQYGGLPLIIPTAQDTLESLRASFRAALAARPDVIVSTAGVSVGAFDLVRTVMAEFGQIDFWRINLRPGKPLAYGHLGGVPFFGLPGNPVSAQVTFLVFVRPVLQRLGGLPDDLPTFPVVLGEAVISDGRRSYIRVKLREEQGQLPTALTTGTQSSGALTSMVYADALLIIPEGVTQARAGEIYPAFRLRAH
ncbi:MAG: molybdopterin molybdotransferase MoeA [Candidatus Flexifilum sp.]|jgi:molybdopterin molybdotransferase